MGAVVTGRPSLRFLPAFALGLAMAIAFGARAEDLATIKQRGTAIVGTQADYPPFEFIENGKIVGYDKDLLDSIIAAWGVKLEQLDLPFAGLLTGLMQNKFDFVCTALLILPERSKKLAMTLPIAAAPVGGAIASSLASPLVCSLPSRGQWAVISTSPMAAEKSGERR